jgi:hypothetical protein
MEKNPLKLKIGEWLPDLPDFDNPGSRNVRNVYAKTKDSYGPVASPAVYSGALDARNQGAVAYFDKLGNVNLFAGTATKLWRLTSGSVTWTDVSKVGGYNTPSDGQWKFEYFNGKVVATNYADPQQVFDIGTSAKFADLSAAAPRAAYCAFVKNFLMVANTYDAVSTAQPQRVWWPALADPTNWPTPGSIAAAQVQSSYNDLLGDNGVIQGIVGNLGNADGAIFMERAVFRVIYAGPPVVFDFPPAEGVRGCVAPNSIVQFGNLAYYLGPDGFYVFDGQSSQPIGADKFDKTFYADLDQSHMDRIVGVADPINRQIIWAYPGAGNMGGNPNHLLMYNWQLERATVCDVTCETIARMLSVGYTLDQLYTVLGYTLDTLPAPLDSRVWTGGQLLLGIFDVLHKLNYFTGPNLSPTVDTTESQPFSGRRFRVKGARPIVDGGVPSVAIGRRERLQDPVAFTPAVALNSLGLCPVRTSGRYGRARITLPAGSSFSHIQGVELDGDEAGSR